jgi:hypothetical protein
MSWSPIALGYPAFFVEARPDGGWWVGAGDWSLHDGSRVVLFTIDGRKWIKYDFGELDIWHIRFMDSSNGWMVAEERFFRTVDGGESWIEVGS